MDKSQHEGLSSCGLTDFSVRNPSQTAIHEKDPRSSGACEVAQASEFRAASDCRQRRDSRASTPIACRFVDVRSGAMTAILGCQAECFEYLSSIGSPCLGGVPKTVRGRRLIDR